VLSFSAEPIYTTAFGAVKVFVVCVTIR